MTAPFPDYVNPPVTEVVCGINFAPLENFKAIHLGLFWETIKAEFPDVQEHPPLMLTVEQLAPPTQVPSPDFHMFQVPPLPRVWFLDSSGNGIVQVQRDTFLHNWRKLKDDDQYPRFRSVIATLRNQFELFRVFVERHSIGPIKPIQCELSYVNHIYQNELWESGQTLEKIFPDFGWRHTKSRFLPDFEGVNTRMSFRLPDNKGRLHVTLQTGFKLPDNTPLISLESRARGVIQDASDSAVWDWFELAHEWIVKGFADLTSSEAQKSLWGERK